MKRVLIVDDSLAAARHLENVLAASGEFAVVGHARNGSEAIRLNRSEDPDIICMDMNMPGMDGLTALRTLAALDRTVKVVMVTSLAGVGDRFTEALRLGAQSVISKPFAPESLLKVLRELSQAD